MCFCQSFFLKRAKFLSVWMSTRFKRKAMIGLLGSTIKWYFLVFIAYFFMLVKEMECKGWMDGLARSNIIQNTCFAVRSSNFFS